MGFFSMDEVYELIFKEGTLICHTVGAGMSEKVSCTFKVDGHAILATVESDNYIDVDRSQGKLKLVYLSQDQDVEATIVIFISKTEALINEGFVIEFALKDKKPELINSCIYEIAGCYVYPVRHEYEWERKYELADGGVQAFYQFLGNKVKVTLSRSIVNDSPDFIKLSELIEDEVFVFTTTYSFCRSTRVEWVLKCFMCDSTLKSAQYIRSTAPEKFQNLINPMRQDTQLWSLFIEHVLSKSFTKQSLITNGVFQAIGNLCIANTYSEWTLISHAAALEGLCKNQDIEVVERNIYRKIREIGVAEMYRKSLKLNVNENDFNNLKNNIMDNTRILNGYPTKWYVKKAFEGKGLGLYSEMHIKGISSAISTRNIIVHTGVASKQDVDIYDCIRDLRNAIYVLVLSFFEYEGSFYFVDQDQTVSITEYVK
jgi:hypothetical protein